MKGRQMRKRIRRFSRWARGVVNYLLGEWWCARFHRPLIANLGGYGGRNVWGRRRKEYYGRLCLKCERRWEKPGRPKPLTPEQERACSEAFGSAWVGGKGVKAETHLPALTPPEVEQLLAIHIHNLTRAGDLISTNAEKSLREKGLVDRMEGWAVATDAGDRWLKCSGLAYKFEKKAGDAR